MYWHLRRPPAVTQGVGFKCWAAALESWLAVTPGRPKHTQAALLNWGKMWANDYHPGLPDGAVDAEIFKKMVTSELLGIRMIWDEIPANQGLGDEDLFSRLTEYGYLFLSFTLSSGVVPNDGGVRHCVVVWAADRDGNVTVMNPTVGSYQNKTVDDFGSPMLIAYRPPEMATSL